MIRLVLTSVLSLASAEGALALTANFQPNHHVIARSGLMVYQGTATISGQQLSNAGNNFQNIAIEAVTFDKKDRGIYFGYRMAMDRDSGRNVYEAAYAGRRFYPFSLAVPIQTNFAGNYLEYDFGWRWFIDAGMSIGRFLLTTRQLGVLDISSPFVGINVGTGISYSVTSRILVEITGSGEYLVEYGPVPFSGFVAYAQAGLSFIF